MKGDLDATQAEPELSDLANSSEWIEELSQSNLHLPVIIPALNEEEGIGATIKEIENTFAGTPLDPVCYVVDGTSRDRTIDVAQSLGAHIIRQSGRGKGNALSEAFKALPESTRYVVMTDADYTYPANRIPEMLRTIAADPKIGMVTGNRFEERFNPLFAAKNPYYLGNRLLAAAQYLLNRVRMRDPLTGLRILRYDLVKDWTPKSEGFDIEVELNSHIEKSGYEILETPIEYRPRIGEKKLHIRHGIWILYRIIRETFSHVTRQSIKSNTHLSNQKSLQS